MLILALLYTASFLPYQVAFLDEDTSLMKLVNNLLDAFFWCDICINFISAYELPNGNYEPRSSKIIKNYLKGWFWIDLISTFPTEAFGALFYKAEGDSYDNVNKLARLARIPRLYRLTRILRTLRILKVIRYHSKFSKWFTKFNMSQQGAQIAKLAALAIFLIHVTACLWYYLSKLQDFAEETWVTQKIKPTDSNFYAYFNSVYWSLQVLTTVGFGDFPVNNTVEHILNVIWMLFGVSFYQVLFG